MATENEIVAVAESSRNDLSTLERRLQERIDNIDFDAFAAERELTEAEKTERQSLRASQAELREAFQVLAFVTLRRLDESDEVIQLHTRMSRINKGLKDDLDRLKDLEEYAEIAAKVADGIGKLIEKAAAIMPS